MRVGYTNDEVVDRVFTHAAAPDTGDDHWDRQGAAAVRRWLDRAVATQTSGDRLRCGGTTTPSFGAFRIMDPPIMRRFTKTADVSTCPARPLTRLHERTGKRRRPPAARRHPPRRTAPESWAGPPPPDGPRRSTPHPHQRRRTDVTLTVEPLEGTTFGAEVHGVDLRALADSDWHRIEDAFHTHGILVFHGQDLTREEHMAFARRFGGIELQSDQTMRADLVGKPIVLDISNVDENGVHITDRNHPRTRYLGGNEGWHSDSSFKPVSSKASILLAIEAPREGGETGYADMRAAYDALPAEERERLEGLTAYHSLEYSQAAAGAIDLEPARVPSEMKGAWHPLVRTHPATGRKSLFIGRHACQIRELPVAEGQALLERLREEACRPPRIYYHRWVPGDVVVWDNRCMLHRATSWDLKERRVLRHVRVAGDA